MKRSAGVAVMLTAIAVMSVNAGGAKQPAANLGAGRKDKVDALKSQRETMAEKAEAAKEQRRDKVDAAKEARKEKSEDLRNKVQENRNNVVDRRGDHQEKRIQHGISKGYLTDDEVARLQAQQSSIDALQGSFTSDGKLTGNEFRQLQQALNEASRCIWSEKHDTDGNQMAVYRLGANVFANSTLTAAMNNENLSGAEARALLKDFRRTVELKRTLATGDLSDSERAKLQSEYDDLLNRYFEVRG